MGGDQKQSQTQDSTSVWKPVQSGNYEELLNRADAWLNQGGFQLGSDYTGQMEDILGASQNMYMEMMNSNVDRNALNNAMGASAQAATTNFQRNVLPGIQQTSNQAGAGAGSRSAIAEGLAMGDLNSQIAQTNAQLAYEAEQNNIQRRMAGAQGLGNLMSGYQGLSEYQASRANSYMQSLLAYKDVISGNMGGTETGTTTGTASGSGGLL
ncbi:particle protein [Vibrio phage vB_ValP_IME234]|nr:particle protein [Vibrio phage vB_ValP_IME234]